MTIQIGERILHEPTHDSNLPARHAQNGLHLLGLDFWYPIRN